MKIEIKEKKEKEEEYIDANDIKEGIYSATIVGRQRILFVSTFDGNVHVIDDVGNIQKLDKGDLHIYDNIQKIKKLKIEYEV